MEFKRRVQTEYPTRLQLYKTPPVQTIGLQEFEELALQRLKCENNGHTKNSSEHFILSPCDPPRNSMCSSMTLFWSPSFVGTPRSQPQDLLVPLRSWSRETVKLGGQDSRLNSMYVAVASLMCAYTCFHQVCVILTLVWLLRLPIELTSQVRVNSWKLLTSQEWYHKTVMHESFVPDLDL